MQTLELLVGTWELQADFPAVPGPTVGGSCTFTWMEGKRLLVQRTQAPDPVPDNLAVIAPNAETGAFRQHYFDTRGVVRLYAMTFDGNLWELTRTEPDFSPLDFCQRFTGTVVDGGDTIIGAWQQARDGGPWEHDFDLTYRRTRA